MRKSNLKLILPEIKQAFISLYQDQLESIILYGSQARGDAREDSDIDILVVLKSAINPYKEIDRTSKMIAEICLKYDVLISRHFISSLTFNHQNNPFIHNIKKEGILR